MQSAQRRVLHVGTEIDCPLTYSYCRATDVRGRHPSAALATGDGSIYANAAIACVAWYWKQQTASRSRTQFLSIRSSCRYALERSASVSAGARAERSRVEHREHISD